MKNKIILGVTIIVVLSLIVNKVFGGPDYIEKQSSEITLIEYQIAELDIKKALVEKEMQEYCLKHNVTCGMVEGETKEIENVEEVKEQVTDYSELEKRLMSLICERGTHTYKDGTTVKSPLCNNRDLYYKLTEISAERDSPFQLALGIAFSESKIGTHFNPSQLCSESNNWGGLKGFKTDSGKLEQGKMPNTDNGATCWLYNFQSFEQYWVGQTNTIKAYEKGCANDPHCISVNYVGGAGSKQDWVDRVNVFYKFK